MKTFSAVEQERIEFVYRTGEPLMCPACDVSLDERTVPPSSFVSYVRHRLLVVCPSCQGHHVLDRRKPR